MQAYPHSPALPRRARRAGSRVAWTWPERLTRTAGQAALIVAMVIGSLALWVGSPLGWLWLASRLADSPQPGMGLYALLLGGVILTSVVLGRVLAGMDRSYRRLSHERPRRVHQAFLRSSGQEQLERLPAGPLGVVMGVSVAAALVALVATIVIVGRPFVPLPM